ncbi:MAG TPA: hypothetical protein VGW38_12455, partial [Chloroflexota bacterium]|nr:hypothetical protein [Chloroflexota bacterium]
TSGSPSPIQRRAVAPGGVVFVDILSKYLAEVFLTCHQQLVERLTPGGFHSPYSPSEPALVGASPACAG